MIILVLDNLKQTLLLLALWTVLFGVMGCQKAKEASDDVKIETNYAINPDLELGAPPTDIPEGMVYVPAGQTTIGSLEGQPHEKPRFVIDMPAFLMDKHPVTVADFRAFVQATGYQTFSDSQGDGIVFDFELGDWTIKKGVNWEYPMGKDQPKAPDDHPVTLLTIADAEAYLAWVGKRLPTEFEWEHAARGLKNRNQRYAWGDSLVMGGKYMTNTWNGDFPQLNTSEDGYLTTAPVAVFGMNDLGLTDMGGNVWEWTSSWFIPYQEIDEDIEFTEGLKKVLRGGSFMCHESYCHGYRVSARSSTPPDNNMFHIGFRGVMDL